MNEAKAIPMPRSLQEIVGALLFASETPLTAGDLKNAVRAAAPEEGEDAETAEIYRTCTAREIDEALKGLGKALEVAGCGFALACAAGAYRIQTVPPCGRYVRAMLKLDRPGRIGRATLETLAIIAYRQPVTKSEIEEIRGVDVSGNIKTLMEMELVRLVGKSELPGHPFLYGTTPVFLEHFGIPSLGKLDEFDPTLQRADPKAKAALYKKEEKAAEEDGTGENEVPVEQADGIAEKQADGPAGEEEAPEAETRQEKPDGVESTDEKPKETADDDGFFIDDTPDEFDDEFDDEDEDEDGEEEGSDDEDGE